VDAEAVLAAATYRPAYHPRVDVAAEPVGGLCTQQRGRDGVGWDMEPGAARLAASGEDAGVMSRATPSAGRPKGAPWELRRGQARFWVFPGRFSVVASSLREPAFCSRDRSRRRTISAALSG